MPFTEEEKLKVARRLAKEIFVLVNLTAVFNVDDLKAAANDIEGFIQANTGAINNALPEPFKTTATTAQKRLLVTFVAMQMSGLLEVDPTPPAAGPAPSP